jgi:CBS domain-containing protein
MEISEIVTEDVVTVYFEDNLLAVADVLREQQVGSAVVLDASDDALGIVTDRDLVVYGRLFADALEQTLVNDILSLGAVSVTPDRSVEALTETMREEGVRRVPVIEDGELQGIVTLDDVVVHLAETSEDRALQNIAAVIERESPPRTPTEP